MKRSFLLFTVAAGIGYLTLSSYSEGPQSFGTVGNRTGSPGSSGTCADAVNGCHSAQSANTTGQFSVADATDPSVPVTTYVPGHTYIVTITGNNPTMPNFGFQAITLEQAGNTETGTVAATEGKTQVATGFTAMVEHSEAIGKGPNNNYEISYNWTAPTSGVGSVTFYGIINAVNNDADNTGDEPGNTFSLTLTENTNAVADLSSHIKITAFPNPVTSNVNIKLEGADNGTYTVKVMDVTGRTIQTESVRINGTGTITLETNNWASGLHFAQVMKDGAQRMIPIVKN